VLLAIAPAARLGEHAHSVPSGAATACAVLLVALLGLSLLRTWVLRPWARRARVAGQPG
jgi:hypothetical protein